MTEAPNRFPLAWPAHRQRRKASERRRGDFSETKGDGTSKTKPISLGTASERLEDQIERLGGVYAVLSTNVELRMDGRPRADRSPPADPGAAVYFQLKGKPYTLACDTYTEVAQNIAALANHIDALRRQERYGVASAAESLQAFQALPAPDHALPERKPWRHVLGFEDTFPSGMGPAEARERIQRRWKSKSIEAAGNEAEQSDLNIARDAALKEFA